MNQPQTEAGKALLDTHRNPGGDWHYVTLENLTGRILAIEAQSIESFLASEDAVKELAAILMPSREHHENCATRSGKKCDCWFEREGPFVTQRARQVLTAWSAARKENQ